MGLPALHQLGWAENWEDYTMAKSKPLGETKKDYPLVMSKKLLKMAIYSEFSH